MKTLIILSTLLFSLQANAYSKHLQHKECNCVTILRDKLNEDAWDMNDEYKKNLNSFIKLDNEAEFYEGTNQEQAIVLIHGFIASPFEVRSVAENLNKAGYTVYMPLLYGFGGYGDVANAGKLTVWKEQIKNAVKNLSGCYKKISIGGISLGAALATDYVLSTKDPKISSLVLMSPYYDISQSVAKLIVGPLSSVTESASLSTLFTLSRSDDLVEILKNKKYYSDVMPFMTLQELFKLSDEFKNRVTAVKSNVPVFLAYSEFDTTINLETAVNLPKSHFNKITYYKLAKELKVPHQITYESSNPKFVDMTNRIGRFIWNGFLKN